jgi:hypothetical protein
MPQQRPQFRLTPLPQPNQGVLGGRAPVLQQSQLPNQIRPQAFVDQDFANRQALSNVLSDPNTMAPIGSGSWAEGLARALQVGMQVRGERAREQRTEQGRAEDQNNEYRREETLRNAAGAASREDMARVLAAGGEGAEAVNVRERVLGDREGEASEQKMLRFNADLGLETLSRRTPILADQQRQVGDIEVGQSLAEAQGMNPILQQRARMDGNERMRVAQALRAGQPQDGPQGMTPAEMPLQVQAASGREARSRDAVNVLSAIETARGQASAWTTGLMSMTAILPGTPAHDLARTVDTIVANIGFEKLQEMRANSPTGGALGSVTERELALLQSVISSLATSQSREQFLSNLDAVEAQYQSTLRALEMQQEEYLRMMGGGAAAGEDLSDEELQRLAGQP